MSTATHSLENIKEDLNRIFSAANYYPEGEHLPNAIGGEEINLRAHVFHSNELKQVIELCENHGLHFVVRYDDDGSVTQLTIFRK